MAANYLGDWFVFLLFQVNFLDRLLTCHVSRSALLSSSTSSYCLLFICKLSLNSQYTRVCVYAHRIVSPDKSLGYIKLLFIIAVVITYCSRSSCAWYI